MCVLQSYVLATFRTPRVLYVSRPTHSAISFNTCVLSGSPECKPMKSRTPSLVSWYQTLFSPLPSCFMSLASVLIESTRHSAPPPIIDVFGNPTNRPRSRTRGSRVAEDMYGFVSASCIPRGPVSLRTAVGISLGRMKSTSRSVCRDEPGLSCDEPRSVHGEDRTT